MTRAEILISMLPGFLLAAGAEPLLARMRRDLPPYRRHFRIFIILAISSLAALWALDRGHLAPGRWTTWLLTVLGSTVGLAFATLSLVRSRKLASWGWQRGGAKRPDHARPLILVADPHWSEELVGLQAATRVHPEADWLFLGDVFDVWVGLPGMTSDAQRSFLSWARERRRAGRWVGLWMGNREFFLDGHAGLFDLMGEGVGGGLEGEALAFEHGDLINAGDWQYRLWNRISRSGPMWLLFRLMPSRLAAFIAAKLERQLRTTNRSYKLVFPRQAFGAAAAAQAPDVFITGHFHTHEVEGNGIALPWAFEGAFMVWRDGRVESLESPTKT
ncbi:MAG: hypothetical protein IPQ13_10805 [Holophagaceae bacterium]|nr:hypothetical protein [Holophagaceae bacterium]